MNKMYLTIQPDALLGYDRLAVEFYEEMRVNYTDSKTGGRLQACEEGGGEALCYTLTPRKLAWQRAPELNSLSEFCVNCEQSVIDIGGKLTASVLESMFLDQGSIPSIEATTSSRDR